jgi:hypothetical protein
MRIKVDYVTNSSSTCYVVCLPNNKEWILKNLPESDWDEEAGYEGGDEAEELITKLLKGESIWNEDNQKWYGPIIDFCEKNNFIFAEFEVGSECGQISNLTAKDVNKMAGILGIDWIKEVTEAKEKEEKK